MKDVVSFVVKFFSQKLIVVLLLLLLFVSGNVLHLGRIDRVIGDMLTQEDINEIFDPKNKGKVFMRFAGKISNESESLVSGSKFINGRNRGIIYGKCKRYGSFFAKKCEPDRDYHGPRPCGSWIWDFVEDGVCIKRKESC